MISIFFAAIAIGIYGLISFPTAVVLCKAWEAIAWHFNLPMFDYWQMYFITWALLILKPSGCTNRNTVTSNSKD